MGAVRVQLVGALAVMRDGSGAEASVGSRKARLLLALLAAHRGAHVPLGQIVDALWCEQPPQRPHRAVATLVSRLRAELGRTVVVGGPAGYRLGGGPAVSVDLDEAAFFCIRAGKSLPDDGPGFRFYFTCNKHAVFVDPYLIPKKYFFGILKTDTGIYDQLMSGLAQSPFIVESSQANTNWSADIPDDIFD